MIQIGVWEINRTQLLIQFLLLNNRDKQNPKNDTQNLINPYFNAQV